MKNVVQKDEVVNVLKQCFDPELPVDLWNLGLIYDIQIQEAYDETKSDINIIMSLTTPGCTMGDQISQDVRNCLLYTSPSPRDGLLSRMPSSA